MILVLPALGVALLAVLFVDVLFTVFHPQGHGGPVHRRQNQLVWRVFQLIATHRDGATRPQLLALAGPVMAVLSVATWGVWLVLGFALIYAPFIATFAETTPHVVIGWVEVMYYSGSVASTLGLGDVVASTPALRLITVLEAMTGFALFAVATTYVLAIFRELAGAHTLALELASLYRWEATGLALRRRGDDETFLRWTEDAARRLLRVVHAHGQYPIMHYFRPRDSDLALPVQLGRVLSLVDPVGQEEEPAGRDTPAFQLLRDALRRYLIEVNRRCVPGRFDPPTVPLEQLPDAHLHTRLLHYLGYAVTPPGASVPDSAGG